MAAVEMASLLGKTPTGATLSSTSSTSSPSPSSSSGVLASGGKPLRYGGKSRLRRLVSGGGLRVMESGSVATVEWVLIMFCLVLWSVYSVLQVERYIFLVHNPVVKQEVLRRGALDWPWVTICNARRDTNITSLSTSIPSRLHRVGAKNCVEFNTTGMTSADLPEAVLLVNIHHFTTTVSPLWGAFVYIHGNTSLTSASSTTGLAVPAGQAGVARIAVAVDSFMNGTDRTRYEVQSSSTLTMEYPGYQVTTVVGVSLRWETLDVEYFVEYIDYTFDDLIGLSAGVAGVLDILLRLVMSLIRTFLVKDDVGTHKLK